LLGRPQHWTLSVLITDQAIYQSNMPFAAAMAVFLVLVTLALVALTVIADARERRHEQRAAQSVLRRHRALLGAAADRRRRCFGQRKADLGLSAARLFARMVWRIFLNPEWRNALFASVTLALLSAALAVAIALPLAWFLWRRHAPWANIFSSWASRRSRCRRSSPRSVC
jgi:ABC-type spermidine/putrescine transport system permease subunit I